MPSATFFRLPPEKRARLLDAARWEFARVSFADASINQIIRRAGISRGAFYLYFKDKDALFRYLLDQFIEGLLKQFSALLVQFQGDLFATLPALFDRVMAQYRANPELYRDMIDILRNNASLHVAFFPQYPLECDSFLELVDASLLNQEHPDDLELSFNALVEITGHAIREGILSEDPAPVRRRYTQTLEILNRGMAKTPTPALC